MDKRIDRYVAELPIYNTGSGAWRVYDRLDKQAIACSMNESDAKRVAKLLNEHGMKD